MTVHVKKCHPESFQAVRDGRKPFEWRKEDDCTYAVDDVLLLLEWRADHQVRNPDYLGGLGSDYYLPVGYTGEMERRVVTYVLRDRFEVPAGFVVLGLGAS